MLKIAGITSGVNIPSSRFRIIQYQDKLRQHGIDLNIYNPMVEQSFTINNYLPNGLRIRKLPPLYPIWVLQEFSKILSHTPGILKSFSNKITWISRLIYNGYLTLDTFFHDPIVFDIDDAVWLYKPYGLYSTKKMAKKSSLVFAGNAYLADWVSKFNSNVIIIPTAIDTDRYLPRNKEINNNNFKIGWTGTSSNFPYISNISSSLNAFLYNHKDAYFSVCADKYPENIGINPSKVIFEKWSPETEVSFVQNIDVGIMPLDDNDWTRGKCSFKMLQYMACGKPVIVSPYGMNKDVLSLGNLGFGAVTNTDWVDSLNFIYNNLSKGEEMGKVGRSIIVKSFSSDVVSKKIAKVFKSII